MTDKREFTPDQRILLRTLDWRKLEAAFKDAVGGLPNYKRAAAFEFVNHLHALNRAMREELDDLADELVDHRVANRVLRPTHDMPAIDAPQGATGSNVESLEPINESSAKGS